MATVRRRSSGRNGQIIGKVMPCLIVIFGLYCGIFLKLLAGAIFTIGDNEQPHDNNPLRGQPNAKLIEKRQRIATQGSSMVDQLDRSKFDPNAGNSFFSRTYESPLLKGFDDDASKADPRVPPKPTGAGRQAVPVGGQGKESVYRTTHISATSDNKDEIDFMLQKAAKFDSSRQYMPCLTDQDCDIARGDKLLAYNSWNKDRYICGNLVRPKAFIEIKSADSFCHQGFRLYEQEPALKVLDHDKTMKSTELFFDFKEKPYPEMQPTKYNCSVPCEQYGTVSTMQVVFVGKTDLKFTHSMEAAENYNELKVDPRAWTSNMFFSTTSFQSDIPLPYFSWHDYKIHTPAVDYNKVIKGASFIANNCGSANDRESVMQKLGESIKVDSLGMCLGNAEPPEGSNRQDKDSMMNKYLFHFSFENCNEEDYISEKLWGALRSGTLPVYMGAPNIQEHVPDHSIISWHDFETTQELGEYLKKVAADQELYESYHTWRSQPLPEHFHRKYDMTHVHSACRTCKWAYAKQRGLGWNHDEQEITDLRLSRKLCLNRSGKMMYPVVEQDGQMTRTAASSCSGIHASEPMVSTVKSWKRTVWFHDGVIDISLEGKSTDVYQLSTPLQGARAIELRKNVYRIQDSASRFTIIGDSDISISAQGEGSIDIRTRGLISRVRIILEDVDTFHGGGASDESGPSYFYGNLMETEFAHPLMFVKILPSTSA